MWTPFVHLYSHLNFARYFFIFVHYFCFKGKSYDSQCYKICPRSQAQKWWHEASNLVILIPRSMFPPLHLDCLFFLGNIFVSDLYELTKVLFIKFVLHTGLKASMNVTDGRRKIRRKRFLLKVEFTQKVELRLESWNLASRSN